MTVFLSLLVCALNAPSSACHVVVPHDLPIAGLAACQVSGMQTAAQWTERHPGWRVAKVRCSIGNKPQAEDQA